MRKPRIIALLDALEHRLGPVDHDVCFHLREMALDLVRHHDRLAELEAHLAAGTLGRRAALRALDELRIEFTTATLAHWDFHLGALEKDLRRRLAPARRRRTRPGGRRDPHGRRGRPGHRASATRQ